MERQFKIFRPNLKMPVCIPLEDRRYIGFISSNALIEDPIAEEKEKTMINPWTAEEKENFVEKLATYGKNFSKIASFLKYKTIADCVEFYYKNHKSKAFDDVKKCLLLKKQSECLPINYYLVTSEEKLKKDANAVSLHMSGSSAGGPSKRETTSTLAACGVSCEALSSCTTTSTSLTKKIDWGRTGSSTPEVALNNAGQKICADDVFSEIYVDWTDEEKSLFVNALSLYGKDFGRISTRIVLKSKEQCKIFFSKARNCLGLDVILGRRENSRTLWGDANGERSDTEVACTVEINSGICSTQSCPKADVDLTQLLSSTGSKELPCNENDAVGGSIVDGPVTKGGDKEVEFSKEVSSVGYQAPTASKDLDMELGCSLEDCNQLNKAETKNETVTTGVLDVEDFAATSTHLGSIGSQDIVVRSFVSNQEKMEIDTKPFIDTNGTGEVVKEDMNDINCPISSYNFQNVISCMLFSDVSGNHFILDKDENLSRPENLPESYSVCFADAQNFAGLSLDCEKHKTSLQEGGLTKHGLFPLPVLLQEAGKKDITLGSEAGKKDINLGSNTFDYSNLKKGMVAQTSQLCPLCGPKSKFDNSSKSEISDGQVRHCSESAFAENEVEVNQIGDFKLFGKIMRIKSATTKAK